jgi:hypothetical protein
MKCVVKGFKYEIFINGAKYIDYYNEDNSFGSVALRTINSNATFEFLYISDIISVNDT